MTLIRENLNAATIYQPVTLRARYTVEIEPFAKLGQSFPERFPMGKVNRVCVGDLPTMWPAGELHEKALLAGRLFLNAMESQGFKSYLPVEGLRVLGPYSPRGFERARNGPLTIGHREDEQPFDGADFILEGEFLATRGKVIER